MDSVLVLVLLVIHGFEPNEPWRGLHDGLHAAFGSVVDIVLTREQKKKRNNAEVSM